MKRQIDLSTIPTDSLGKYQWNKSIGCECEFDYDDVQGTMKIVDTCAGKRHHVNNLHFSFITKEEFNKQKQNNPDMVVGNLFNKVA